MIKVGEKLPDFKLSAQDGKEYSRKDFSGQKLVVYFYPKDNTPGWTNEAVGFQQQLQALKELDANVVGVSKDSVKSHQKFAQKYDLEFPLLADVGGEFCKKVEVLNFLGFVKRKTLIVSETGEIIKVFSKVDVKKHPAEVVEYIAELN